MAHIVLIALVLIIGRLAWVHFHEFRTCRWCHGERGRCWRCKGTGMTRRWGAWHTHKLVLALREVLAEWRNRV